MYIMDQPTSIVTLQKTQTNYKVKLEGQITWLNYNVK